MASWRTGRTFLAARPAAEARPQKASGTMCPATPSGGQRRHRRRRDCRSSSSGISQGWPSARDLGRQAAAVRAERTASKQALCKLGGRTSSSAGSATTAAMHTAWIGAARRSAVPAPLHELQRAAGQARAPSWAGQGPHIQRRAQEAETRTSCANRRPRQRGSWRVRQPAPQGRQTAATAASRSSSITTPNRLIAVVM